ncbi:MAG: SCO6880 family protein [Acidimicrobiales bacterium]
MADPQPRRYRFAPPATNGVLLGLDVAQCTFLAAGVIGSGLLLRASVPAPIVLTPLAAAGILAFGVVAGVPVRHQLRLLTGWTMARAAGVDRWTAASRRRSSDLPAVLRGLEIDEVRLADGRSVGIVIDHTEATVSVVIAVAGGAFTLAERAEQERLLQQWGDALAPFCVERGLVSSIRWLERSEPSPIGVQRHGFERRSGDAAADSVAALRSYEELVERAEANSTAHTTHLVITADQRRAPRPITGERSDRTIRTARALLDETMLLIDRLDIAGLSTPGPLGPQELRELWQRCLTPFGSSQRHDPASLVELTGRRRPGHLRLGTFRAHRDHLGIDNALHAASWWSSGPGWRSQPAGWSRCW